MNNIETKWTHLIDDVVALKQKYPGDKQIASLLDELILKCIDIDYRVKNTNMFDLIKGEIE